MTTVKLPTVLSAMSYALDLTEGQPLGHAARSCLIGMRIAEELQISADERSDLFYALLMKDAGCSTDITRIEPARRRIAIPFYCSSVRKF